MKTIKVVAAIIVNNDKIFATQRGYGEFKDGWEFPGGKIEQNETAEAAIVREIQEELDTTIKVEKYFDTVEYDYPTFHLSMDCFICSIKDGNLTDEEKELYRVIFYRRTETTSMLNEVKSIKANAIFRQRKQNHFYI